MHIREHRGGFNVGFTEITSTGDDTGIALGVHKFKGGERYVDTAKSETAWLLMDGRVSLEFGGEVYEFQRRSLFDDLPICLHVSAGTEVRLTINEDSEFTVYQTANAANFSPRLYREDDVESEDRGKGQVGDTCWRVVRTIFGIDNRDPVLPNMHTHCPAFDYKELILTARMTSGGQRAIAFSPCNLTNPSSDIGQLAITVV